MANAAPPRPARCANCEYLYYPDSAAAYLCDVCQGSLEGYVRSMAGARNPVMAWWDRQRELRAARKVAPA